MRDIIARAGECGQEFQDGRKHLEFFLDVRKIPPKNHFFQLWATDIIARAGGCGQVFQDGMGASVAKIGRIAKSGWFLNMLQKQRIKIPTRGIGNHNSGTEKKAAPKWHTAEIVQSGRMRFHIVSDFKLLGHFRAGWLPRIKH